MKRGINCPYCGKLLGKYENIRGEGDLSLYCKRCGKERQIRLSSLSAER